mmetsp:Transcript_11214/g.12843  ORF Transcript_11214/g.12843 Transcript_11214/m.12843 type:complete len:102 (+) Transcript_11214:116-421(+)|eukprot:CAMPEP_0194150038 /NCGR_PEP_ID=MMETSP0152-20130528/41221_1 /TAXON_ID=1049557 /ORGANISM="Thalassiothrix antarctica, Strain L6-D1" /LENGTH=101 /DNA_ID=CAMNT_0038852675 /DNA_START=63 /DNA_END=368 /DNA_ORIENTATION=+
MNFRSIAITSLFLVPSVTAHNLRGIDVVNEEIQNIRNELTLIEEDELRNHINSLEKEILAREEEEDRWGDGEWAKWGKQQGEDWTQFGQDKKDTFLKWWHN